MVDQTISTQIVREAPEIEAYKLGLVQEAQRLYNQPMSLPAMEAAGLSGTELQAIDLAKQGIGAFEPYIQAGSQGLTQGMDLAQRGALAAGAIQTAPQYQAAQEMLGRAVPVLGQGIGGILGSAQAYDPTSAAAFMNPYQQAVTQNAPSEEEMQLPYPQESQDSLPELHRYSKFYTTVLYSYTTQISTAQLKTGGSVRIYWMQMGISCSASHASSPVLESIVNVYIDRGSSNSYKNNTLL